jgi:O-antigen/teichoic acid export membrane protein
VFRQFFKDTSINSIQQIWAMIIGLSVSVVVARGLGADGRGVYAVVMFLSVVVILLLNSGIEPAIIYHIARKQHPIQTVVSNGALLTVAVAVFGCVIASVVVGLLQPVLFPQVSRDYLYLCLLVIPTSINATNSQAIFRGLEDFQTYSLIEMITQPITLILSVIFIWGLQWSVGGAILALVIRHNISIILVWLILRRRAIYLWFNVWDSSVIREMVTYSLRVYAYNMSVFLNQRVDLLLLNVFRVSPAVIGVYDVAVSLAERFWTFSRAVSIVIFSRIAALEGDEEARNRLTTVVVRYVLWGTLLVGIVLYGVAEWAIVLIFGVEYGGAAMAFRLLLPGIVMLNVGFIISNDISGRGKPQQVVMQSLFGLVVNVLVNLVLIPRLSIAGAALASSISYTAIAVLTIITFSRLTGVPWQRLVVPSGDDVHLMQRGLAWLQHRLRR